VGVAIPVTAITAAKSFLLILLATLPTAGKKRTGAQPTYPGPACSRQVCEKASSEAVGTIRDDVSGGLRDATGQCRQTRMGRSRDAGLQRRLRGFVAWAYPAGLRHGLPHLQPEYEGKALK